MKLFKVSQTLSNGSAVTPFFTILPSSRSFFFPQSPVSPCGYVFISVHSDAKNVVYGGNQLCLCRKKIHF